MRVLLTPDARAAETGSEDWKRLSYLDLVRIFRGVYNELHKTEGFHFLRFYLAGVLLDVCGWPRDVTKDDADRYAVVSYLKTVHNSLPGEDVP